MPIQWITQISTLLGDKKTQFFTTSLCLWPRTFKKKTHHEVVVSPLEQGSSTTSVMQSQPVSVNQSLVQKRLQTVALVDALFNNNANKEHIIQCHTAFLLTAKKLCQAAISRSRKHKKKTHQTQSYSDSMTAAASQVWNHFSKSACWEQINVCQQTGGHFVGLNLNVFRLFLQRWLTFND